MAINLNNLGVFGFVCLGETGKLQLGINQLRMKTIDELIAY
jgi:hypothetical protein